jgi:UBX domain-containing protein 1/4
MSTETPMSTNAVPPSATDDQISEADAAAIAAAMSEEASPAAKSLKCVDCGKLFKNADLANYHAEKSGHENFEESVEEVLRIRAVA